MTNSEKEDRTDRWMNRRTLLKGTAAAGVLGGGLSGTASATSWRELTLCAAGNDVFSYRIEVSGEIKRGGTYESDSYDTVGDDFVEGAVSEGRCDSFLFTGEITGRGLSGPGEVTVDGTTIANTGEDDADERELTFCAAGDELFSYRVETTGSIARGGTYESDSYDTVGHDFAEGSVSENRCDSFLVTGEIADLELSGPGNVRVDGNVVRDTSRETDDRERDDQQGAKILVVSSPNTDELLDYTLQVTGELEKLEPNEDSGPAVDEVTDLGNEGTRLEGTVGSGDDIFRFTGELNRIDVPSQIDLDVRQE